VYFSIDPDWWESIDIADAQHRQTLLAWAMNDGDLPVAFGGPLRLRETRQLGYKNVKFVNRLMVPDSLKGFVSALDPKSANFGYAR
jgi:DMSO/TMAO reductase YedYZ molybdopterin-dependent catalytic subunit